MLLRLECITCASWGVSRILRKALRKNLFREYCEYHTHPRIFCKPFGLRFGTILQPQLSLPPSPNPPPATKLQYFFQSIAPAKKNRSLKVGPLYALQKGAIPLQVCFYVASAFTCFVSFFFMSALTWEHDIRAHTWQPIHTRAHMHQTFSLTPIICTLNITKCRACHNICTLRVHKMHQNAVPARKVHWE